MSQPTRLAIYPGSFDPFTMGHRDVLERAAGLFDRVVVAILVNPDKRPMFSLDERIAMIRDTARPFANVEVDTFEGLLTDYATRRQAVAVIRGLRTADDFTYEQQMALMNRHLQGTVDTVFLAAAARYSFISASLVREVITLGGSLDGLVPEPVLARIAAHRQQTTRRRG